jgi:hypothetical protein
MRRPTFRFVLPCGLGLVVALGCSARQVEIIGGLPGTGGGGIDGGAGGALSCPASLAARLATITIAAGADVAWQKPGYSQYPTDERIALAVQPNGQAQLAWMAVNPTKAADGSQQGPMGVHVTPLDASFARRGNDAVVATGQEVSGLVAHDDGFALLTRDANPGTPIDEGDGNTVAFLVKYKNGEPQWQRPLTGSESGDAAETFTIYSPFLEGQLVWSGSTYGAYFAVRGGVGDPSPRFWRDALVFRDPYGGPAPWTVKHGCQNNGGIRLIPDPGKTDLVGSGVLGLPDMTGLCIQQQRPGIQLTALEASSVVSDQETQWAGYSGAKFGSLLKLDGGYLVFWLSLGATNDHKGHDIRMARLDASYRVTSGPSWVRQTPGTEEWNLHIAPYGPDQFLMMYEEIAITGPADPSDWALYLGNFVGTHLVLLDATGAIVSDEIAPGLATTANAEPVVLGNGDVAWPFVNSAPDFTQTVRGPNGPGQTNLHVARVRYCE